MLSQFEKDALEAMSNQMSESVSIIKAVLKRQSDTTSEQYEQAIHVRDAINDIQRVSISASRLVNKNV